MGDVALGDIMGYLAMGVPMGVAHRWYIAHIPMGVTHR
jgi:hypothetical protein